MKKNKVESFDDLIFSSSYFGEEEYIICVKAKDDKVWENIPIGMTISEKEAQSVIRWLNDRGGLNDLWKIAKNIMGVPVGISNEEDY
jgi:hypothetical protein